MILYTPPAMTFSLDKHSVAAVKLVPIAFPLATSLINAE